MNVDAQSFFISYSRADYAFVLRLAQDLKSAGASVWLDQVDIELSENWDTAVEKALVGSPRLLAILSPTSVASNNVMDEVSFALEEKKIVIPILYQPCEIPFRLRRLQRLDFTGDYDVAMQILLSRLRLLPAHEPEQQTPSVFAAPGPFVEVPISPRPILLAPPPVRAAPVPPIPVQPYAPISGNLALDIFGGRPKPWLASSLAFFFGLGALYNREFRKAGLFAAIYIVAMLLAQMGDFFGLVFLGVIIYMMYDGYATAKKRRDGVAT